MTRPSRNADPVRSSNGASRRPPIVVVGVDGSRGGRRALLWAADEADRRGADLRIVHSDRKQPAAVPAWYDPSQQSLSPGEAVLDDAAGLVATGQPTVLATTELSRSSPVHALRAAARDAELLVVGSRGAGGFRGLSLGSVSDQIVQHAPGPVVVVHDDGEPLSLRAAPGRVVVGVDGSRGSDLALQWATAEAALRQAELVIVHAWQYPPVGVVAALPPRSLEGGAEELVAVAVGRARERHPGGRISGQVREGDAVPVLVTEAAEADLLVVGRRGLGPFQGGLLGSVAHQCARLASVPVSVVRPVSDDGRTDDDVDRRSGRSRKAGVTVESGG
jgi:nucleotide-binding universal stress UspA family protein